MRTVQLVVALVWLVLGGVLVRRGWSGKRAWAITIGETQVEKASPRTRATNTGLGILFLMFGVAELIFIWLKTTQLH